MNLPGTRLIVVLDMHRSSTGPLTRGLAVLGVDLRERSIGGVRGDNEKVSENIDVNTIDNELLRALGRGWHTLLPITRDELLAPTVTDLRLRAIEMLRSKLAFGAVLGFQSPWTSTLLPFWQSAFEYLRLNVGYVIALRNPLSIMQLLGVSDAIGTGKHHQLWLEHMLCAALFTAGKPRVVVDFDDLASNPARQLRRIADCLDLRFDFESSAFREYTGSLPEADLRHSSFEPVDLLLEMEAPGAVGELYGLLRQAASDSFRLDDPRAVSVLERMRQHQLQLRPTLSLLQQLDDRSLEISKANADLIKAVSFRDAQIRDRDRLVTERNEQLAALRVYLDTILGSRSWRLACRLQDLRRNLIDFNVRRLRRLLRGDFRRQAVRNRIRRDESARRPIVESRKGSAVRLVCFYLPQFHSIPENDAWWGKDFTEWTRVRPAQPQFVGHYQPHVPGDLGYYNLLDPGVQRRQVEMAKLYGVGGFCFYFYWFGGRRLLEAPVENYLNDSTLDLPFCLCWANENWTRRWDGLEKEILIAQRHSPEDDLAFIAHVARYLRDPRYIRIGGRPLLVVYQPSLLPSAVETAMRWRNWCREKGLGEIFLAYTQSFETPDPAQYGFDAAIEFPPNESVPPNITKAVKPLSGDFACTVYDWRIFPARSERYDSPRYKLFRAVCPSWDNTARRGSKGTVFVHNTPGLYRHWLEMAIADTQARFSQADERLVFINAWNEWAEGAHLEPDARFGYAWLEATRDALAHVAGHRDRERSVLLVGHDCYRHGAQLLLLEMARRLTTIGFDVSVLTLGGGELLEEFRKTCRTFDATEASTDEIDRFLAELETQGVRLAVTSTTVSGRIIPQLKNRGYRVLSLVHEMPGVIRQMGLEESAANVASLSDVVVFPAETVRQRFSEIAEVDQHRVMIRPQGLLRRNPYVNRRGEAHRSICQKLRLPSDTQFILSIAYMDLRKGPDLFVESAAHVLKENPKAVFVWVGHCDPTVEPQIRSQIRSLNLCDRIILVGYDRDPMAYYAAASVYALSSREDPFPNVILEAASVGVPVVAFEGATGAGDFVIRHGGRLARHLDCGDFAKQICDLLECPVQSPASSVGSLQQYALDLLHALDALPRISVVVPNYNYAKYIVERLDSILQQTFPIYELIVLDDASSDDSVRIIEDWLSGTDCDAHLVRSEANSKSAFRQWAKGLARCRGDLIWVAEADDLAEPSFLEELVRAFADPSVVLAFSQSMQIDESGNKLEQNYLQYTKSVSDRWNTAYVGDGLDEIRDCLTVKNTIPNVSAVLFRRSALEKAFAQLGETLYEYRVAGDWLLYVHVLAQGKIAFNSQSLNLHRRHRTSITNSADTARHLQEVQLAQRFAMSLTQPTKDTVARAREYLEQLRQYFGIPAASSDRSIDPADAKNSQIAV